MKYDVILADPPWSYNKRRTDHYTKFGGGAGKQYELMHTEDIIALRPMLDALAKDNCILFQWVVGPKLDIGIEVIKKWGFRFCTIGFVWVKRSKKGGLIYNPGYYTASNIELCLIGCRGSMKPTKVMVQQVIESKRLRHSEKPEEVRKRIDQMYPGKKKIELFARVRVPGWDASGIGVGTPYEM